MIIKKCLERHDFDTVLVPVNPAEPAYKSLKEILPLATGKDMGIIGMKVYFRGLAARIPGLLTMEPLLRFALTQPISTAVIGCDNTEQLEENVYFAASFVPMTAQEKKEITRLVSPFAKRLMYYKP